MMSVAGLTYAEVRCVKENPHRFLSAGAMCVLGTEDDPERSGVQVHRAGP